MAWGIPVSFMSVVIVPIAGNAGEHVCATVIQTKEKMDILVKIAVGSSTEITMFTIPFCVILGWIMDVPLDLNFQIFETTTLFLTLLVVAFLLQDDSSNYYKGLMLMFCYLIITASFFIKPENHFSS
ncbi:Vacuolar cation/proton exchanger [Zostera marina]|uniref:Vacuolar cation/proton exchanger n=1 Tax=Zostera marina TaxID=29655 RepID=A0A0K9Q6F2_ZOSMR|nr:Vacuolar cation/proton exchanger [Zostera marina]